MGIRHSTQRRGEGSDVMDKLANRVFLAAIASKEAYNDQHFEIPYEHRVGATQGKRGGWVDAILPGLPEKPRSFLEFLVEPSQKNKALWDKDTDVQAIVFSIPPLDLNNNKHKHKHAQSPLVVAFRGTSSLKDVCIDLDFKLRVPEFLEGARIGDHDAQPAAHSGMCRQYDSIRNSIMEEVDRELSNGNSDERPVVFTGHSLGGALATLASVDMSMRHPDRHVECITFGSPRVMNPSLTATFDRVVDKSVRVTHGKDVVTRMPTPIRYRHVNGQLHFDHEKKRSSLSQGDPVVSASFTGGGLLSRILSFFQFSLGDHNMEEYVDCAARLVSGTDKVRSQGGK